MYMPARGRQAEGEKKSWMSSDWALTPAFNSLHPIHKFHVLVFGLGLGHDHCSRWGVKLEEEKKWNRYLVCASFQNYP